MIVTTPNGPELERTRGAIVDHDHEPASFAEIMGSIFPAGPPYADFRRGIDPPPAPTVRSKAS